MARTLRRDLGLPAAVSVVVGSMIGVGIFLGPRVIATHLPTPSLVLLAWVLGGLLVFCGALTYAELGASYPESGGIYAYMREAYGPMAGFLSGWSGFAVGKAASVSALAVGFAEFLPGLLAGAGFLPEGAALTRVGQVGVALALILLLSAVNVVGVRFAGHLAVVTTTVKVAALLLLVAAGFAVLGDRVPGLLEYPLVPADGPGGLGVVSAFGLALVPVFFAYDGWVNSTQVAEEVRDPAKNVPRSLILGTLGVVAVYALANLTYLLALGPENVGVSGAASETAREIFGDWGSLLVVAAILVSIVGTVNAVILSGPRIAFAMARDGVFPRSVEKITRWGTPGWSIALQGGIAAALVLLPPIGGQPLFDTLLTYIIVASFVFYGAGAGAVFILRRREPHRARPYKVPLYPVVPLVFVGGSALFLLNAFVTAPLESLGGLLIVLAGLPAYFYWRAHGEGARVRSVAYVDATAPGAQAAAGAGDAADGAAR